MTIGMTEVTAKTAIPLLGEAFRELVTRAGLRQILVGAGLEKDLDGLADERRLGSHCALLETLEDKLLREIEQGADRVWAECCRVGWTSAKRSILQVVHKTEVAPIPVDIGRAAFNEWISVPLTVEWLGATTKDTSGPDVEQMLEMPFKTWMEWLGLRTADLVNSSRFGRRTIDRWRDNKKIERLHFPYGQLLDGLAMQGELRPSRGSIAGWLMIAIALQSMSEEFRNSLKKYLEDKKHNSPKTLAKGIGALNAISDKYGADYSNRRIEYLNHSVNFALVENPMDPDEAMRRIDALESALSELGPAAREYRQYFIDVYRANVAVRTGQDAQASVLFSRAAQGLWWRSNGLAYVDLLNDALAFSAGTKNQAVKASHYWDRACLLGFQRPPFRKFDQHHVDLYSRAYETIYFPRKALKRAFVGLEVLDDPFIFNRDMRKNPNQKNRKTQRTFLMEAILRGTIHEVRELLDNVGNVNSYIEETGITPLVCAFQRAYESGNRDFLYEILIVADAQRATSLPPTRLINHDTANRPFGISELKTTPLELAIDMADLIVIRRLVALGANMEKPCADSPNALMHAIGNYGRSVQPDLRVANFTAYANGETAGDILDARRGAVLHAHVAETRTRHVQSMIGPGDPSEYAAIWHEIARSHAPPADKTLSVIAVLLELGADPNAAHWRDGSQWSATLLAAVCGSVPLMKLMLDHGGDPTLSLDNPDLWSDETEASGKQDARWIARARNYPLLEAFLMSYEAGNRVAGKT